MNTIKSWLRRLDDWCREAGGQLVRRPAPVPVRLSQPDARAYYRRAYRQ